MTSRPPSKRVPWFRVALLAAGAAVGGVVRPTRPQLPGSFQPTAPVHAAVVDAPPTFTQSGTGTSINITKLGIKRDDFLSERELRRRKTTQFSEAEEEIMELEEWEVDTQWFRDLQMLWAGIASIAGMFVLYKGGVMWENWIKEQEQKDMEEEIELTGTFIDPRAVRKEEDEEDKEEKDDKKTDKGPDPGPTSGDDQGPPDGLESLEKIFGKS